MFVWTRRVFHSSSWTGCPVVAPEAKALPQRLWSVRRLNRIVDYALYHMILPHVTCVLIHNIILYHIIYYILLFTIIIIIISIIISSSSSSSSSSSIIIIIINIIIINRGHHGSAATSHSRRSRREVHGICEEKNQELHKPDKSRSWKRRNTSAKRN